MILAPIYSLPFKVQNRWLNGIVSGWHTVFTTTLQSGAPMSIPGDVYLLGDPRLANPSWDRLFKTGVIDVNGTIRNVESGEQPGFQVGPPFTLRTPPLRYGNLRNRWATTFDYSVIKNVKFSERMKAQFRVEAFNVFNTLIFPANPNLTPTSVNFGKLFRDNGQNNSPRLIQLGFRFEF